MSHCGVLVLRAVRQSLPGTLKRHGSIMCAEAAGIGDRFVVANRGKPQFVPVFVTIITNFVIPHGRHIGVVRRDLFILPVRIIGISLRIELRLDDVGCGAGFLFDHLFGAAQRCRDGFLQILDTGRNRFVDLLCDGLLRGCGICGGGRLLRGSLRRRVRLGGGLGGLSRGLLGGICRRPDCGRRNSYPGIYASYISTP